jgi:hypothetical protein
VKIGPVTDALFCDGIECKDGPESAGVATVLSYYSVDDKKTNIMAINMNNMSSSPESGISIHSGDVTSVREKADKNKICQMSIMCVNFFSHYIALKVSQVLFYFFLSQIVYAISSISCKQLMTLIITIYIYIYIYMHKEKM